MSFPTTRWTLLASATLDGDPAGREALAGLCGAYRRPVLAYVVGRGMRIEDAEDLTQDFFVKLMQSRAWKRMDPVRGRFRSFLLGILHHVMEHAFRRAIAAKRGGGATVLSLEEFADGGFEVPAPLDEDVCRFDREWALAMVMAAVATIRQEFSDRRREEEFGVLQRFLPGAGEAWSYERAAGVLGISEQALKSAIYRLRGRFREVLRAAVSVTVSAPHEIDEELRYLGNLLLKSDGRRHEDGA